MIFKGTLEDLKTLINSLGYPCHWEDKGVFKMEVFDIDDSNLRLNCWPESGRLEVMGEPRDRSSFVEKLRSLIEKPTFM
jgi:hypothetical protein